MSDTWNTLRREGTIIRRKDSELECGHFTTIVLQHQLTDCKNVTYVCVMLNGEEIDLINMGEL